MSSRLNPRDYDLGELRDAVHESSRSRGGRRDDRRDDGRRDAYSEDDRADGPADGVGPAEVHPSNGNGESPVEAQLPIGGSPETNGSSGGEPGNEAASPSGDAEAGEDVAASRVGDRQSRADERVGSLRTTEDRPAVGRVRQNRGRFARSSSRDRTADGDPRRRDDARADTGTARQPGGRTGRSGRVDRSGATAPDHRSHGTRSGGFELLSGGSGGDVERPYLDRLPQGYRAQVEIFAWLEELLATSGREATLEALSYYEAVGWLSGESREDLEAFLEGLTAAEPPDPRPLAVDDHRHSLRYVARLAQRVER